LENAAEWASGFLGIMQLTGGSSSVRAAWAPMRIAGATARAMLLEAAASLWQVDANRLVTQAGKVVDPATGRTFAYGALARWAASVELSPVIPRDDRPFRLIGTSVRRVDTPDKVNGKATFGIDVKKDGMLYAAIRSAPALSGRLDRFNPAAVKLPEGVERLVKVDDRTVAAVADSYWTAQRALQDPSLKFEDRGTALSSEAVFADFTKRIRDGGEHAFRNDGDVRTALAPPRKVIEVEYSAPYLAHACMEPLNCTAVVANGSCQLWLGTQAPALVACAVAKDLGISASDVTVHTTLLGGGFGRRLEVDVAVQAARVAKEFPGKPVKLIWSREEDMRRDVYRPAALARLSGALGTDGMPDAIHARLCSQPVMKNYLKRNTGWQILPLDKTDAEGLCDQPYAIPNFRVEHVEAENEVPVGNWRAVGHGFNGFAMECFLDELAREGGKDPFAVRAHLLQSFPGKIALLNRLKELSGWGPTRPARIDGRGMAYRQNFGSDVAQVVDIVLDGNRVKVEKVFCVIDCGQPVDRRGIEAQVQSGIVFGLSAALMQASNFHQFDALRIHQCPEIVIDIVQHNKEIGGAGEAAVAAVAPALANALIDAKRPPVRRLPLTANDLEA
jgi:isoquinoline 1-oxidoreductase beta subunit